ncbi:putative methyltransferase yqeM [Trichophyton interdigitale]|uniref:Methyltransferase yqeM n=1 Tax=Trichophyton interdigitale TaxID=101480 RepID=A0A9P4YLF9_9EURO|nr:putative methyltransferase yqeM [Trichophyton interdigitale]KAF3898794.1 putative methyltransferase yqeM [Trichophyton interdigitale]KAG8210623.1 putative methyltransferase yqeM [Trichophyton interdigitale]
MAASAEALFDDLGKRYEDAFADSPNLHKFLELVLKRLPKHSRVLDVGCGTGKPVAHTLASAGHQVQGIDGSQTMVNIASSQVSGEFMKVDMRMYEPGCTFDGVFAILSLFQFSPGEIYSMCCKYSEWLKPGGYLVIGVTPSTDLPPGEYIYDSTWDCTRQMGKPWMNSYTDESFFSEERWKGILRSVGFEMESDSRYSFTPKAPGFNYAEIHYLQLARKVEDQPLLGPYPRPTKDELPSPSRACYSTESLISEQLNALLGSFTKEEVLCLGCIKKDWVSTRPNIRMFDETLEKLPFSAEQFDVVLVSWQLEFAVDMEAALGEILRVTRKTISSRILFIQGAPDNEFIRFLNTTSGLPNVRHQGYLLHFAKEYAASHGFGKATVSHIKAHYAFPDQDISKRCGAAVNLLGGNTASMVDKEELFPKLELHFRGSEHAIGHNMAMLDMRLTAN